MNAALQLKEQLSGLAPFQLPAESQLRTFYDEKYKTGWFYMHAQPRPCFTPELLSDIDAFFSGVRREIDAGESNKYDFLVLASDVDGIFNLGGDLHLFADLIQQRDRQGLLDYALQCVNVLYQNMVHLEGDLTTIALVKGDALGGGFEAALSANVLVAERGSKLGLPEVLFNLFPGMGAYSLLSRKIGKRAAEEMIMSGRLYTAEELYEMQVVDVLADPGEGELAVYQYIKRAQKNANSFRAMNKVKDICRSLSYEELYQITEVWVDAALELRPRDLKMMHRLVSRQGQRLAG
jgi:DSF synthase